MEKCPNCGYKIASRWPFVLMQLAFGVLYFSGKYGWLKDPNWIVDVALLMYLIGSLAFGVMRKGQTYDLRAGIGKPGSTI